MDKDDALHILQGPSNLERIKSMSSDAVRDAKFQNLFEGDDLPVGQGCSEISLFEDYDMVIGLIKLSSLEQLHLKFVTQITSLQLCH